MLSATPKLTGLTPRLYKILSLGLMVYMVFYTFESPIRYALNMMGADELIFIRDFTIILPVLAIFIYQLLHRCVNPAYYVYGFIVLLHGFVMIYSTRSAMAAAFGAKLLVTSLVGAVGARLFFEPTRRMAIFIFLLWSITCIGVGTEKYFFDFPWIGMETHIGDVTVEISRDWQVTGENKRAAGFTRASINTAYLLGLTGVFLLFRSPRILYRLAIGVPTLLCLYWTTQKGAILVFIVLMGLLLALVKRPTMAMKIAFIIMLVLDVGLPLLMPGYYMDRAEGMFSMMSFNIRVEDMWPRAWHWIDSAEVFPFGVGLGGIGGGQRFFAPYAWDAADNLFILIYAYFGLPGMIYLLWACITVLRTRRNASAGTVQALATMAFIMGYGVVISIIEDQMGSLFLGAGLAWLYEQSRRLRHETPMQETYFPAVSADRVQKSTSFPLIQAH